MSAGFLFDSSVGLVGSMWWLCIPTLGLCGFLQDAKKTITKNTIKSARLKEIRQEILNSQKLKVGGCRVSSNFCFHIHIDQTN